MGYSLSEEIKKKEDEKWEQPEHSLDVFVDSEKVTLRVSYDDSHGEICTFTHEEVKAVHKMFSEIISLKDKK